MDANLDKDDSILIVDNPGSRVFCQKSKIKRVTFKDREEL
jgi:hypothetical protein